jgi:hypothetical protein
VAKTPDEYEAEIAALRQERDEARRDFGEVQASLFLARNRRDVLENALTEADKVLLMNALDRVIVARRIISKGLAGEQETTA